MPSAERFFLSNCWPECGSSRPPNSCSLGCAERWLPLLEDCEEYLAEYQPLSEACEETAGQFLGEAPSTVTVSGLVVHPAANGNYSIAPHTVAVPFFFLPCSPLSLRSLVPSEPLVATLLPAASWLPAATCHAPTDSRPS